MYLYRTTIYKDTSNVLGLNISQNNTDKTDFETNYKNTAIAVSNVVISETTFLTELSYATFKTKVVTPILWSDVKYTDDGLRYVLHISSSIPL